ncbi:META domain-containing protein [Niveibacterium sp. SC-1]|uniref:META domain-containing protein n=1 Tax=Niveibacterium sp. SC-1 TaxID=3135646 RepID=UPI00311F452A
MQNIRRLSYRGLAVLATLGVMSACAAPGADKASDPLPLENTMWNLDQLEGQGIAGDARPPFVSISSDKTRISGFSGCNRFTGAFKLEGASLSLGPLAGTRMACAQGGELEDRFLRVLGQVDRYAQDAGYLYFYVGSVPVARFKPGPKAVP